MIDDLKPRLKGVKINYFTLKFNISKTWKLFGKKSKQRFPLKTFQKDGK
jgi:hypothetical protein